MTARRITASLLVILVSATWLPGCVNHTLKSTSVPPINTASRVIPDHQLLNVGIPIFDAGIENYEEDKQIYPEVRKAEANFMPQQLAEAMQESAAWGAVRVIPDNKQITDLLVEGRILHSDGETLELHVVATDSRHQIWLDRKYKTLASRYAYSISTREHNDPFQAVYNMIANDLLTAHEQLLAQDFKTIRLTTELRFARSFSPDSFDGYLNQDRKGAYLILRLPAENDPMLERIRGLRERDHLFIDTMQGHYSAFNAAMMIPYQDWRKLSFEEVQALRELKEQTTRHLIAGAIAIVGGIAAATSDSRYSRAAGNVAVVGGGYLLKSGIDKRIEAQIHVEALEELGLSLEAEIAPQIIELEDRTVLLSGNVQDQYDQWREILADIYRAEIGDLSTPAEQAELDARSDDAKP